MDLSKFLKKGPKELEAPEPAGEYDYRASSLAIVKRVVGCSDDEAEDLVMALCQLIEDHGGAGVTVKIKS